MLSKGEQEYVAAMKTTADLQLEMAKSVHIKKRMTLVIAMQ
jgi:hypothetical protein